MSVMDRVDHWMSIMDRVDHWMSIMDRVDHWMSIMDRVDHWMSVFITEKLHKFARLYQNLIRPISFFLLTILILAS